MILSDNETAVDFLYYESIASAILELIHWKSASTVTIGIHGDWGAGKSSILAMVESALKNDSEVVALRFNGWLFEGFEDAKFALIETIITELQNRRPEISTLRELGKKLIRRIDWLKVAKTTAPIVLGAAAVATVPMSLPAVMAALHLLASRARKEVDIPEAINDAASYLKDPEAPTLPEEMHQFHAQFREFLDAAKINRLVVMIDDLDRCLPQTAVSTLEAIRLFLFVPKTAFIIAADEAMIEYSVREHFPDLPPSSGPMPYARNYLEKIIQIPFRIPALGLAETRTFITLLLAENILTAAATPDQRNVEMFQLLLREGRETLKKPWENRGLDRSAAAKILSNRIPPELEPVFSLSERITPILVDGTKGNPRQIKRFLNSLLLRRQIARVRGFAAGMDIQILAKLMLAENFVPSFYERLVALVISTTNGKVKALDGFEKALRGESKREEIDAKRTPKKEASPEIQLSDDAVEWNKDEWMKAWARIEPPLGDVDLRLYVFLTRDKRIAFGRVIGGVDRFDTLVQALLGPQLAVKRVESELDKLTAPDAEQVFEAIQNRIMTTEDLSKPPPGINGISALVKAHPSLQNRLVALIGGLPVDRVGPWAVSGWASVINDPSAKAELDRRIQEWAAQTANKGLAVVARAAANPKGN